MTSHNPAASGPHNDYPMEHHLTENGTNNNNNNNNLDDIWGDDNDTYHQHHHHSHPRTNPVVHQEVSDMPRLSAAHSNAGYRDGITHAKARTAQQGFDEGYGLGATIGARAGQLLGVLEGLAAAVGLHSLSHHHRQDGAAEEARRIDGLLDEARRELGVVGVFDGQFWAADGNWRYPVSGGGEGGMDGGLVVFADVAEAHPLLRKWRGIVRGEAARYGVDWEVLKDEVGDGRGEEEADEREREREARMRRERERENRPAVRGKEALAW